MKKKRDGAGEKRLLGIRIRTSNEPRKGSGTPHYMPTLSKIIAPHGGSGQQTQQSEALPHPLCRGPCSLLTTAAHHLPGDGAPLIPIAPSVFTRNTTWSYFRGASPSTSVIWRDDSCCTDYSEKGRKQKNGNSLSKQAVLTFLAAFKFI